MIQKLQKEGIGKATSSFLLSAIFLNQPQSIQLYNTMYQFWTNLRIKFFCRNIKGRNNHFFNNLHLFWRIIHLSTIFYKLVTKFMRLVTNIIQWKIRRKLMVRACNWPTLSIKQASTLLLCPCMTPSQYFESNTISTSWLKNSFDIDFKTSDTIKTTIESFVYATLLHDERNTNWCVARDEDRSREERERERERMELDWDEALHRDFGGNRPQIIRLKPIQYVITLLYISVRGVRAIFSNVRRGIKTTISSMYPEK